MGDQHTPSVNTKELFYCETHGMFEPGRFDVDWNTDFGCPVHSEFGDRCDERLLPVDLSGMLAPGNIRQRLDGLQRHDIYSDLGSVAEEESSEGDWVRWEDVTEAFAPREPEATDA